MEKTKNSFLKNFFKKKTTLIIGGVILLLIVYSIVKPENLSKKVVSDFAKYDNLKQTVLVTGQVTSETDLDLSFNTNGIVKSIKVAVGDKVKKGQILATLDQGGQLASLTSAQGALKAAKARYNRILEGATNEDIKLSEVILEQTKITQDTLVKNAYENLLNSTPEAVPENGESDYTAPTISGTYNLGKEGQIILKLYSSSGGKSFSASGLVSGTGLCDDVIPQPIGNSGLYIKFPSGSSLGTDEWIIDIPNKKAADYLTNYNNYQATVTQAKSLIDQRQAELNLKKAKATNSEIDLAMAEIISAEGQVQAAQARYEDTIIRAPADGTITSVDIKLGELAQALKEAIVLQDVTNIYLEANINEADIVNLNVGMPVDVNFDSLGTEKNFKGQITKIDPSSVLVSNVVYYKVTASVEEVKDLKPGMTANMTILIKEKDGVISVPSRAILTDETGNKTIRLVTNTKRKNFKEVPVSVGMNGDGGLVEITSGLKEKDEYVVVLNK